MSFKIKNSRVHIHDNTRTDFHFHVDATFLVVLVTLGLIIYFGALCILEILRWLRGWVIDTKFLILEMVGVVTDPEVLPYFVAIGIVAAISLALIGLMVIRWWPYICSFFQNHDDYDWE